MNGFRTYILVSVGIIVGSITLFGVAVAYFLGNSNTTAKTISETRSMIESRAHQLEFLAAFKAIENKLVSYETRMDLLLPVKDELFDYPASLTASANKNDVNADFVFRSEQPSVPGTLGYAEFALTSRGALDALHSFFTSIDNTGDRYLTNLISLDVSSRGASEYQIVTQGRVYYR